MANINVELLPEKDLTVFTVEGDLSAEEILFSYEEMFKHVLSIPSLQINRQAFIVGGDREYGKVRMFLALAENEGIFNDGDVFRSLEEALQWLIS